MLLLVLLWSLAPAAVVARSVEVGLGALNGRLLTDRQTVQSFMPRRDAILQFSLNADWPTWELSPLQEAAEFLASEKPHDERLFWDLIDELEEGQESVDPAASSEGAYKADEHDRIWALTLSKTSPLLHPLSQSIMTVRFRQLRASAQVILTCSVRLNCQVYLSIRAYAPTLELHRSLRGGERRVPLPGPGLHAPDVALHAYDALPGPSFEAALADPKSGCHAASTSWAVVLEAGSAPGTGKVVCSVPALAVSLDGKTPPSPTCA
jgi:hypothetical protein